MSFRVVKSVIIYTFINGFFWENVTDFEFLKALGVVKLWQMNIAKCPISPLQNT